MVFISFLFVIIISVLSETASQAIYFLFIRRELPESSREASFHWLPHKRKKQIDAYSKLDGKDNSVVRWGRIAIWLYRISWIALAIGCILVLPILFSR